MAADRRQLGAGKIAEAVRRGDAVEARDAAWRGAGIEQRRRLRAGDAPEHVEDRTQATHRGTPCRRRSTPSGSTRRVSDSSRSAIWSPPPTHLRPVDISGLHASAVEKSPRRPPPRPLRHPETRFPAGASSFSSVMVPGVTSLTASRPSTDLPPRFFASWGPRSARRPPCGAQRDQLSHDSRHGMHRLTAHRYCPARDVCRAWWALMPNARLRLLGIAEEQVVKIRACDRRTADQASPTLDLHILLNSSASLAASLGSSSPDQRLVVQKEITPIARQKETGGLSYFDQYCWFYGIALIPNAPQKQSCAFYRQSIPPQEIYSHGQKTGERRPVRQRRGGARLQPPGRPQQTGESAATKPMKKLLRHQPRLCRPASPSR